MDTLATYRQIIQTLLIEYAGIPDTYDNTQNHTIFDVHQNRYLLVNMGWQGKRYIHDCIVHIEIIEGQVWIQQNNTDQRIGEELVQAGIAREHIVVGFQPLELRPYANFGIGIQQESMMVTRTYLDLMRRRPGLFFHKPMLSALLGFLHGHGIGYGHALKQYEIVYQDSPLNLLDYDANWEYYFDLWAQCDYGCGPALGYYSLINDTTKSDEEQFHLFFKYLDEFEQELEVRGRDIVLKELEEFKAKRDKK